MRHEAALTQTWQCASVWWSQQYLSSSVWHHLNLLLVSLLKSLCTKQEFQRPSSRVMICRKQHTAVCNYHVTFKETPLERLLNEIIHRFRLIFTNVTFHSFIQSIMCFSWGLTLSLLNAFLLTHNMPWRPGIKLFIHILLLHCDLWAKVALFWKDQRIIVIFQWDHQLTVFSCCGGTVQKKKNQT